MSPFLLRYVPIVFLGDLFLIVAHLGWGHLRFLNLDKEHNLPSWYSGVQLALVGLAALDCYEREKKTSRQFFPATRSWAAVALFLFYLSLDEITVIHEALLRYDIPDLLPPDSLWVSLLSWQIVFGPLLALMSVVLLGLFLTRFGETRALLLPALAGLGCWGLAVLTEALAKPIFLARNWYPEEVAIEEGFELLGATLLLAALCRYGTALDRGPVAVLDLRSQYRRVMVAAVAAMFFVVAGAALVAVSSFENSAWLYRHNARQFEKREKYRAAVVAYEKALQQDAKDPDSLRGLALCWYRLHDYESARTWYDRALEVRPNDARLWVQRAFALHQLGDLGEAEASYRRAIALNPRHARAWSGLGFVLEKQGRTEDAAAAYRKALTLDSSEQSSRKHLMKLGVTP